MRNVDRLLGLWKHVQLQHDVPAAASSLASAPSGVDMLDCKLNADENRRMEIGQNIPQKTYYSFSFIFIHYILILPYFDYFGGDEHSQHPHCILVVLVFTCVAMAKASKDVKLQVVEGEGMIST